MTPDVVRDPDRRTDVLVVGAGIAGVIAAAELVRAGASVLLQRGALGSRSAGERPSTAGRRGAVAGFGAAHLPGARLALQQAVCSPRTSAVTTADSEIEIGSGRISFPATRAVAVQERHRRMEAWCCRTDTVWRRAASRAWHQRRNPRALRTAANLHPVVSTLGWMQHAETFCHGHGWTRPPRHEPRSPARSPVRGAGRLRGVPAGARPSRRARADAAARVRGHAEPLSPRRLAPRGPRPCALHAVGDADARAALAPGPPQRGHRRALSGAIPRRSRAERPALPGCLPLRRAEPRPGGPCARCDDVALEQRLAR